MRTPREYEDDVGDLLSVFFATIDIPDMEIRVRKSLKYRSERDYRSYSPMIDVSVGPFSEERGISRWSDYNQLVDFSRGLIDDTLAQFGSNYQNFGEGFFEVRERTLPISYESFLAFDKIDKDANWNARCFMAIEVENKRNPKHLLGDMLNVSVSGRIGVVIGYNTAAYETFLRQLEYIAYTVKAKKIRFNSKNIIVLRPDQFENAILDNLKEPNTRVRVN